jgi:3-(3-hydroxy-phenyl)propionate hydroxylase
MSGVPPSAVPVAIVGAGPVGVTAANLLGLYGVTTLLVDKETEVVDYPRAAGVDDESLRTFQTAGLVDEILCGTIQNVPLKLFDGTGRCLADVRPTAQDHGWYKRNIFMQPLAEAVLRLGLARFPHVQVMLGTEMSDLRQDSDGVTLDLVTGTGEQHQVRAGYVIAADGGRSPIRTRLGIPLEGTTHARKWVVIDCAHDPLDAPYTALHCDPRRPYVCAHLPDDHRRWEFMLFPGEDADEMLTPERVDDLLRHHVPDPSVVDVIRARVYTHHSRIAARFVEGRVALAGDAAHLMPPWAGQGMNTGIRDVTNLCWKLAAIIKDKADESLLDTYDEERRPHARAMIDLSTTLGRIISPTRRFVAQARDLFLRTASVAGPVRRWTLEMRFKPIPHYREGFVVRERPDDRLPVVGRMMTQPVVETTDGTCRRLDDVLGPWFAVIGFECDPLASLTAAELAVLEQFRPQVVKIVESRAGRRHHEKRCVDGGTVVVEDVHNELRAWFQARGRDVVLVRPDRYVAAMTTADDLGPALVLLAGQLVGSRVP